MYLPSQYSDFSGVISSSLQRTQFIRRVDRRLDIIVATIASSILIPRRLTSPPFKSGASDSQENFYAALHQSGGSAPCVWRAASDKAATCLPMVRPMYWGYAVSSAMQPAS
jgi:hypothetical protein